MILIALLGMTMLIVAAAVGIALFAVLGAGTAAVAGVAATVGMRVLEVASGRRIRRSWDVPVITVHWHTPHFEAEPASYWEFESFLLGHPELQDIDVEEAALAGFAAVRPEREQTCDLWESGQGAFDDFESYLAREVVSSAGGATCLST
jgi:hypothetical protein